MDFNRLAELLFPNITTTPEDMEAKYPPRDLKEGAVVTRFAPSPTIYVADKLIIENFLKMGKNSEGKNMAYLKVLESGHYFYVLVSVTVLEATGSSIRKFTPY